MTLGRQTGFFMDHGDEERFIAFVRTTGTVQILANCGTDDALRAYGSISELVRHAPDATSVAYLWNIDVGEAPVQVPIVSQSLVCLDLVQSDLVEFRLSRIEEDLIRPGRLYVDPSRLVDGAVEAKSTSFIAWYVVLASWIKKAFAYDIDRRAYVGPGASRLLGQGYALGF